MPKDRERHGAPISAVSPDFGPLLGMSLVRGRWLEEVEPQGAVSSTSPGAARISRVDPIAGACGCRGPARTPSVPSSASSRT